MDILQKPVPSAGTAPREEPQGTHLGRSFSLIYSLFYLCVWSRTLGKHARGHLSQVTLFCPRRVRQFPGEVSTPLLGVRT